MIKRFGVFAILCVSVFLSGCASSGNNDLYVQTAKSAQIHALKKDPGAYKLTMYNVSPRVVYFTDVPRRRAGVIPLDKFVAKWQSQARSHHVRISPNAGLNAVNYNLFKQSDDDSVLELFDPRYDAKNKTLTYTVRGLHSTSALKPKAGRLKNVALFIDNWCYTCN